MRRINPTILKNMREQKGFSLDDLAKRSRIDRQTIYRIEADNLRKNQNNVIEKLSKALGITEDELCATGSSNISHKKEEESDDFFNRSQLNLRVSDRARNALSLTAARYKVSLSQVVEIAPLLFYWVAEQSLQQRQKLIDNVRQKNLELEALQQSHLHITGFMIHNRSEAILGAEQKSIDNRDLFGELIDGSDYESYLPDEYDEAMHNPFANFLRKLTANLAIIEMPENSETFEKWDPTDSPDYNICKLEALHYLAGDDEAAEYVLDGYVPLHKIPNELREKNKGEERAKWIRDEAAARLSKFNLQLDL